MIILLLESLVSSLSSFIVSFNRSTFLLAFQSATEAVNIFMYINSSTLVLSTWSFTSAINLRPLFFFARKTSCRDKYTLQFLCFLVLNWSCATIPYYLSRPCFRRLSLKKMEHTWQSQNPRLALFQFFNFSFLSCGCCTQKIQTNLGSEKFFINRFLKTELKKKPKLCRFLFFFLHLYIKT